ncbi:PTS sugar transporter subunit IIA [Caproicibacter fermentans]|uniref:PTS sugar transporter subunit IIA n=1 Tax=Caproicibacter fermentans TaxID=2576756 RepID=A0A7G8TAZ3_9FIRM|nr:PTS sugar transporter subunit IIA [Caproicibacter fermentans]QNK40784.1 PTS sugar transporter subunit IIA [Caproicibacter fermentans]
MTLKDMIFRDCILTDVRAADQEDALRQIFEALYKAGKVKESFYNAVLKRETEYPTGLALPHCNVAIPHVVPEHVNSSALGIAVLREPVLFRQMDNHDLTTEVRIIFSIALGREGKQIEVLQSIMKMVLEKDMIHAILKAGSPEEIEMILRKVG